MGQESETAMPELNVQTSLRRRSWLIFFGCAIVGLGIGMFFAVRVGDFRTGWQGIPIYLLLAGILGRIASSKVELRANVIVVINPLRTHSIPVAAVHDAIVGDDGTLEVQFGDEEKVAVFAFGGSLIDRLRKTSDKAAREIRAWLRANQESCDERPVTPHVHWTRCRFPDMSLIFCVVTAGVGAIAMALTSS
ncbi:hypothetical protein [Streptomyces montanisoli]|uniref:Uncharacterized protein n=1 Tax=Streptomyces montanisoli TaxID=2798581 RepID=A0A940MI38_9ACTN|nr:hypothetical protein [Streptomyces montanisoli]MBP0460475.1 hypothetical protein [Streptomyces montanisoli]